MRQRFKIFLIGAGLLLMAAAVYGSDAMQASTYFGGSGADGSWPTSVFTLDDQGYVYLTGMTDSPDIPVTSGAFDTTYNGGSADCFVAKFTPDLGTLVAATFVGGSESDAGMALIWSDDGWLILVGQTESPDFPAVAGCYDTTYNGGASGPYGSGDTFALRMSTDLSQVTAATYLGGAGHDVPKKLVLDASGRLIIAGHTNSEDFPATPGAYATMKAGSPLGEDCFVAILTADLTGLECASYLGGSGNDFSETLGVNSTGAIYIGGWLQSTDFPTTPGAFDTDYNGHQYDGFVSRFSADLSTLDASTYLGGSSWEFVYAMTLDDSSNVYAAGHTASTDYPVTAGAYDETYNSQQGPNIGDDVFITMLNPDLSAVTASTYLGGSVWENAYGLIISPENGVTVCGSTCSPDFPVGSMAWQPDFHGGSRHAGDAF
nr:hypothetical protein [bacterium]